MIFSIAFLAVGLSLAGEKSLLLKTDNTVTACCPQDSEGKGRCLERLTRLESPKAAEAACAAFLGTQGPNDFFSNLSGQPENCVQSRSFISLTTEQMKGRWWQLKAPDFPAVANRYQLKDGAAIFSAECKTQLEKDFGSKAKAEEILNRCGAQGFVGVHSYIAGSSDWDATTRAMRKRDSGESNAFLSVHGPGDLKAQAKELLNSCRLLDFVFVSAHGGPGRITLGDGLRVSVGDFIGPDLLSPCLLSPRAHVQFSGCDVGCKPADIVVESMLNARLSGTHYDVRGKSSPFRETKFLFNTDLGYVTSDANPEHIDVRSRNGVAVEIEYREGGFVTNTAPDDVPACQTTSEPSEHVFTNPQNWQSTDQAMDALASRLPAGRIGGGGSETNSATPSVSGFGTGVPGVDSGAVPVPVSKLAPSPRQQQPDNCKSGFPFSGDDPFKSKSCCTTFCARNPKNGICIFDKAAKRFACSDPVLRFIQRFEHIYFPKTR